MNNTKKKLTCILKMLYENTDCEHYLDTYQILDMLEEDGSSRPDRKTIDSNISFIINELGFGIEKERGKPNRYRWTKRKFEPEDLLIIADALQTSAFISPQKGSEIISSLKRLTSIHQAELLDREIYCLDNYKRGRIGEGTNIDIISEGIRLGRRIRFEMSHFDVSAGRIQCCSGDECEVSPIALLWNRGIMYMIGIPAGTAEVRRYRTDMMRTTLITETGSDPLPEDFSIEKYTDRAFDMFEGEMKEVILNCNESATGLLADRFGSKLIIIPEKDGHLTAKVRTDLSPAFYAWVFQSGGDVRITGPQSVCMEYRDMLLRQLDDH